MVVPNVRKRTVKPIIEDGVAKGSTVHTEELTSYRVLATKGYEHSIVNHGTGEHMDGDCHVNTIEGYWSRFKNSIRGTRVHVSGKHLQKYAGEFEYRYNRRKQPRRIVVELLPIFSPHAGE